MPGWKEINDSPFVRPDVHDLIAKGFARWVGEKDADGDQAVEFTELGFKALEKSSGVETPISAPGRGRRRAWVTDSAYSTSKW